MLLLTENSRFKKGENYRINDMYALEGTPLLIPTELPIWTILLLQNFFSHM
jgi:hypothetical protein